MTHGSY